MLKNPLIKNILSALAVAVFGFILLNITFLFDALIHDLVIGFITFFISFDMLMTYIWFPPMMHGLFVVAIGLISWFVFKSKLGVFYKAIYMTVPVAVVLVTFGMFLFPWPVAAYLIGALFSIGVLYYFYRTKQPWLYYYTVILISLVLAIFSLSGGEI